MENDSQRVPPREPEHAPVPVPEAGVSAAPDPAAPAKPTVVSCAPEPVPEVSADTKVTPGTVYINKQGATFKDGQKLVLERPETDQRLEVRTVTPRTVTESQKSEFLSYLSGADKAAFGTGAKAPTVRRYTWWRDGLAKLNSLTGWLLVGSATVAAIGAWATLFGVLAPHAADLNANRMEAALAWAAQPLTTLPPQSDPTAQTAAASEFKSRAIQANACVESLQGHQGPIPQIPQLSCEPVKSSWCQKNAGKVAAGATALVTLGSLVSVWLRTRFQQSP